MHGHEAKRSLAQKSTEHTNSEMGPTNSLTKVLMKMHTGVYTKMSSEMPTKLRRSVQKTPESPHEDESPQEDSHKSAHRKFDVLTKMYTKVCSVNFHMS